MTTDFLQSATRQFEYYKLLGEKTFIQVPEDKLSWQINAESNSIATIVKHLAGNMRSRWTDFLHADGEKSWRNRDVEFENDQVTREIMMQDWNEGWTVFLSTLRSLKEEDLGKIIFIRNQGHTVMEAINRQLAHYPYHIGQIVFLGKICAGSWTSLSIPRGASEQYNAGKFAQPPRKAHFTEEYLQPPRPFTANADAVAAFVHHWVQAFNDHDLDSIMTHYADELEFYSPLIPLLNFNQDGRITTKAELRRYFQIGLNTYPDLHFKLHHYFTGINSVVIYYTSVNNRLAAETFQLNAAGKVIGVFCHYSASPSNH